MLKRELCGGTPAWGTSCLTLLRFNLSEKQTQLPCDPPIWHAATGPDSKGARQPGVFWRAAVHAALCSPFKLSGVLLTSMQVPCLALKAACDMHGVQKVVTLLDMEASGFYDCRECGHSSMTPGTLA